jgi:signal transduction histidine kinase
MDRPVLLMLPQGSFGSGIVRHLQPGSGVGGQILVERTKGLGTRFFVTLPLCRTENSRKEGDEHADSVGGR